MIDISKQVNAELDAMDGDLAAARDATLWIARDNGLESEGEVWVPERALNQALKRKKGDPGGAALCILARQELLTRYPFVV